MIGAGESPPLDSVDTEGLHLQDDITLAVRRVSIKLYYRLTRFIMRERGLRRSCETSWNGGHGVRDTVVAKSDRETVTPRARIQTPPEFAISPAAASKLVVLLLSLPPTTDSVTRILKQICCIVVHNG